MKKFLTDKNNKYFEDKQRFIKESLIFNLNENLKECEFDFNEKKEPLGISDATSSLCSTLEAIFLHGLKDSFLQLTFSIIDTEVDRRPNPSFWSVVLLFLHKQVIQEIQNLTQVSTDVGYSRAFIRKAVNECLLSSYLQNIRKSQSSLKSFYHRHAFLYDIELLETIENLLMGIESYVEFNLPCNSSLINVWNDAPLTMSGVYSAPLRSIPIASGEDVAGSMSTSSRSINIPNKVTILSDIYSASISNSIFTNSPGSFNDEDHRMTKLLQKVDSEELEEAIDNKSDDYLSSVEAFEKMLLGKDSITPDEPVSERKMSSENTALGNSVGNRQSWSEASQSQEEEHPEIDHLVYSRSTSVKSMVVDNQPFESLWNEKQRRSTSNFKEVWERFEKSLCTRPTNIPEEESHLDGFEVIKSPLKDDAEKQNLQLMVETLCRLSTECGIDSQGFLCKECKAPLGVDFSKATVCGFDGHYYCPSCLSADKFPIPAKIIFNWDFKNYSVSKKAATFLTDYQFKPFIDFKILNPDIYSYIDEMNRLQKLRIQLNFIRAYIFTCSESTIGELQKLLYAKEYIYESIHLYSSSDLSLILSGALEEMLKRIVAFGKDHCLKCTLCSVKGFICEYCRKAKVIYPFDVDETLRCNSCGTVSHINCFDPTISCPKCERKSKRQLIAMEN